MEPNAPGRMREGLPSREGVTEVRTGLSGSCAGICAKAAPHRNVVMASLRIMSPRLGPEDAFERFGEVVFAPHDGLVDAESFIHVIDAAAEDAFPFGLGFGEMFFAQRAEDVDSGRPLEMALQRIGHDAAQAQES